MPKATLHRTTKAVGMTIALMIMLTANVFGQLKTDTRCMQFMGIPLEGPADTVVTELKAKGFTEWGTTDDGDDMHFRGTFYGIHAKLMMSRNRSNGYVSSVYVTVGSYRTFEMFDRNFRYFLLKLQEDYGEFTERGESYYYVDDYGVIKLSDEKNDNGTRDIKVFFLTTAPFYKDALNMALRGNVMEVITTNPILENPVEHFNRDGQTEQGDLIEREYNKYGYLTKAKMPEDDGQVSTLNFEYDRFCRLRRRILENTSAGLRSISEYTYNDDDEINTQSQKVFDSEGSCLFSITMTNTYEEYDDTGNWTRNKMKVVYWEKETGSQETSVVQTRTISYWDEE